jgi:UDP-3-O-[3-hydroxymyristoyl] glucosamine N-acyltransferase
MELTVAQLAERIGAELAGDGSSRVRGVGPIEAAGEGEVTFVKAPSHYGTRRDEIADVAGVPELEKAGAGAYIVARLIKGLSKPQLVVKNVDAALIETLRIFAPPLKAARPGVDQTAKVGQQVKMGEGVSVGACAVIEDVAEIGANTVIAGGCHIGEGSKVGRECRLDSNVVVYHGCTIGNNVIIQANSTIGSIGFGYSFIDGEHKLIPHQGGVVIEDFVDIGANCCVDRAKFGNTIIGAGTKIDNLVQIAHNVVIGKCCLIAGLVGISGSCRIGDGVFLGGQVGLVDKAEIGDGAMVGAQAGVTHNIEAGRRVVGSPAIDHSDALRILGLTRRLPKLAQQLKLLAKKVEGLEAAEDDKKRG